MVDIPDEPLSGDDVKERFHFLGALLVTIAIDTLFVCAWLLILFLGHLAFDLARKSIPTWFIPMQALEWFFFTMVTIILVVYVVVDAWRICKRIWGNR